VWGGVCGEDLRCDISYGNNKMVCVFCMSRNEK
jgi:hypothetical protein